MQGRPNAICGRLDPIPHRAPVVSGHLTGGREKEEEEEDEVEQNREGERRGGVGGHWRRDGWVSGVALKLV